MRARLDRIVVDVHTFGVLVEGLNGVIGRPVMVGIQHMATGALLAHRIGSPLRQREWDGVQKATLARQAFTDLFRHHGVPTEAVMDFALARDVEALLGLSAQGVFVRRTAPPGSAGVAERLWRDICNNVARHTATAATARGGSISARERSADRVIPIAAFRALAASRIAQLAERSLRHA